MNQQPQPERAAVEIESMLHRALEHRIAGRFFEAEEECRQVLSLDPHNSDALHILGMLLAQQGDPAAGLAFVNDAIARDPGVAQFQNSRGFLLQNLERLEDSLAAYTEAARIEPALAPAHYNKANVLRKLGRLDEACGAYARAVAADPELRAAQMAYADVLAQLGRLDQALDAYDRALELQPRNANGHCARGLVLQGLGRSQEALAAFESAIEQDPRHTAAMVNKSIVLTKSARFNEALGLLEQALAVAPNLVEAHVGRGNVLKTQGRLKEAARAYEQALQLDPTHAIAHSNLLLCLNFDAGVSGDELSVAHRRWGDVHGRDVPSYVGHTNRRDPDKVLRIGLISADFRRHPVGYFLESVLAATERSRLQIICYSCNLHDDDLTTRLESRAQAWRSCPDLFDQDLAKAIRSDQIDILIDLAGHTAGNRLTCFALKPAPVQVTWLGYCHSTGLPAMDYILVDPSFSPDCGRRWCTEREVTLPDVRACYSPPGYAPEVVVPPILTRGHATFGSFNNLAKLNEAVIDLWAELLRRTPDAQLMLNWKSLADSAERDHLSRMFGARGIDPGRLRLTKGAANHRGVLAQYGDIDIALDPFPFAGGLTTYEALWMGVPVVTLPDDRPASRQSLGPVSVLGHRQWAARTADDYVRTCEELINDVDGLAALRRTQRDRMRHSPLCDANRFVKHLESALRRVWRRWCERAQ